MAHSIEAIGDRSVVIGDGPLSLLIPLLVRNVKRREKSSLSQFVEDWEQQYQHYMLGCISLEFELVVEVPGASEEMMQVLDEVAAEVRSNGDDFTPETVSYLRSVFGKGVGVGEDPPTKPVLEAIAELRSLLVEDE